MHICIVTDAILDLRSACFRPCHKVERRASPQLGGSLWSSAQVTGCNAQFFRQWEWPRLLQGRARRGERSACVGVKCHKVCERNLLNHKADTPTAPPAPIIHTIARAMYAWLFCLPIPFYTPKSIHLKIVATLAKTSSMTATGRLSTLRPLRALRSSTRG